MYYYTAYRLGIQSELCLPELEQGPPKADIVIRLGKVKPPAGTVGPASYWSRAGNEKVALYWKQVGAFLIQGGQEIIIDPDPAAVEERVRLFLLGAAMGVLLHQRGFTVLHGSAIAINDGAAAFLGGKGWGKSTMAAMLHRYGHSLLADDVLAVDFSQEQPQVLPGFPQLKLWPDALSSIGQAVETIPRLHSEFEKRDYRLESGFAEKSVYLKRIYLLGHSPEPTIEAMNASQALLELLPHWYCGRFSTEVLQSLGLATQFLQCANLVKQIPVYRLKRPRSLSALSQVAQFVQEHDALALPQPAQMPS